MVLTAQWSHLWASRVRSPIMPRTATVSELSIPEHYDTNKHVFI
jgi:hypothetical protein